MKEGCKRILLIFSTGLFAAQLWAGGIDQKAFSGEITDTFCARNKSHEEMMQEMPAMGTEKQTCAQKCAQIGARYVLFNAAKGSLYHLDDQKKAEAFAGRDVRVVGTLGDNNTLKVSSIEARAAQGAAGE